MTTIDDDAKVVEEIRQLLERLVMPKLDAIHKQLEDLRKRSDSIEGGMHGFRRSLSFLNLAKKDRNQPMA